MTRIKAERLERRRAKRVDFAHRIPAMFIVVDAMERQLKCLLLSKDETAEFTKCLACYQGINPRGMW
jgi:hypothetical protein